MVLEGASSPRRRKTVHWNSDTLTRLERKMASSASTVQEVIIEKNEEDLGDEKEKAETSEESRVAALEERVKGWLLSSKSWLQHKWDAVPEEYKREAGRVACWTGVLLAVFALVVVYRYLHALYSVTVCGGLFCSLLSAIDYVLSSDLASFFCATYSRVVEDDFVNGIAFEARGLVADLVHLGGDFLASLVEAARFFVVVSFAVWSSLFNLLSDALQELHENSSRNIAFLFHFFEDLVDLSSKISADVVQKTVRGLEVSADFLSSLGREQPRGWF